MKIVAIGVGGTGRPGKKIETEKKSKLYKRLLEFQKNIIQDKKYTRKDLRF